MRLEEKIIEECKQGLWGGQHTTFKVLELNYKTYLKVQHEESGLIALYNREGETNHYGGPLRTFKERITLKNLSVLCSDIIIFFKNFSLDCDD